MAPGKGSMDHGVTGVKYHEYQPHPVLRDTVRCFWTHEATYSFDQLQAITPDGCVELIFNFGSPYLLSATDPPHVLPAAIVVGFQKNTLPIRVDGTVRVVAARLYAWGALALLGDDLPPQGGAVTAAGAVWDALARRLEFHVSQGRYEEARAALQEFLIPRVLARSYDSKLVRAAAKLLYHTSGQCRIEELANHCHASVRQLQRKFRRVVGASPKLFARTLRFEQAQRRLMFNPETDLTQLAHWCGYFDQAHFIKEFRAFAGMCPSEYAGRMRQLQASLRGQDVVFLQSEPPARG
jgi:AraC-like DNA-binding protein